MSESNVSPTVQTNSNSSTRQFNVLNVKDYLNAMHEFSQNTKLSDLMEKSFHLQHDITRGLQFDELQELIGSDRGLNEHSVLEEMQKLSDGQSTCLATTSDNPKMSETTVIFGQKQDNKYDVLQIKVAQTAEFDRHKLTTIAIGAVCAGIVTGAVGTPVVGAITTGAILTGAGLKAAYDYRNFQTDYLYAYIFKALTDKRIIRLENGQPYI